MRLKSIKKLRKKGVLYTLSLTLILLTFLALGALFFRNATFTQERYIELSSTQKVYDLDTSIETIFAQTFLTKSKIMLNNTNHSFTIQENFSSDFSEMDGLLQKLEGFVETDFNIVSLDLSSFLADHSLIVDPVNITVKQENQRKFHVLANNNITGYDIILNFE